MPAKKTIITTAVYIILSIAFYFSCHWVSYQFGRAQGILDGDKRYGSNRTTVKSYALTREKNPQEPITDADLQEVKVFAAFVPYDVIKNRKDALGRRLKSHFDAGHSLAKHELIFDEQLEADGNKAED